MECALFYNVIFPLSGEELINANAILCQEKTLIFFLHLFCYSFQIIEKCLVL